MGKNTVINGMKKLFIDLIDMGKFYDAKKLFYEIPVEKERLDFLVTLTCETNSVGIYTFIVRLLLEHETSELHTYAAVILKLSLWEGAYTSALSHARRAVELSPGDLIYKEYLLSYSGMPDCIFEKKEAIELAKQVLTTKPSSDAAREALEWATKKRTLGH
jgi:tetratricopeptide (TPR) repeat protein